MKRRSLLASLAVAGLALFGCERDIADVADETSAPIVTTGPGTTIPATALPTPGPVTTTPGPTPTTATATTAPATTAPAPTFAQVTTTVVGTAVAGNSGGVGTDQTNTFSEAVRNADGTCSGWVGPGGGTWTQGLDSGAPVTFLADDGTQIGSGQLGTSVWEDVDPSGNEQWNCTFPFEGAVAGQPETFRIQVADLPPWRARVDPRDSTRFVVSVDTEARFDVFSECTEPLTGFTEVSEFSVVGQFWANGIPSVCSSGLVVVDIERPCRPPEFASEHIIAVTRADDPSVVIEDASGFVADASTLAVGTEVVVHVVTGRPCG
jgi:hypothetical protein